MKIIKRDGIIEDAIASKISEAIKKSTNGKIVEGDRAIKVEKEDGKIIWYDSYKLSVLGIQCLDEIESKYGEKAEVEVETIHNEVIAFLKRNELHELAINYSQYREDRNRSRMKNTELMKVVTSLSKETDNDNGNVGNNFSAKLLRIASEANKCAILGEMPKEISRAHEVGDLYQHDLDSYNIATNCLHIPAEEVLKRGFNTGYGWINPPKRIDSAADLICILIQSVQNK